MEERLEGVAFPPIATEAAEEQMLGADLVREIMARKERGEGAKRIARELGVDRKTVKRWSRLWNSFFNSLLGALTPMEFADQQGDRPLEQVPGSAALPLLNRPTAGKHQPLLLMTLIASWGAVARIYVAARRNVRS